MFVLFAQVFVFYYSMFCDCLTSRQVILSLKIKKLLYVMQTFEDTIYQFVACKNCLLLAFNSDNQRKQILDPVCCIKNVNLMIISIMTIPSHDGF